MGSMVVHGSFNLSHVFDSPPRTEDAIEDFVASLSTDGCGHEQLMDDTANVGFSAPCTLKSLQTDVRILPPVALGKGNSTLFDCNDDSTTHCMHFILHTMHTMP